MTVATISPQKLFDLRQAGRDLELIDVRTPVEYREVHIAFARNVPLDRLDPAQLAAGRRPSDPPLYVVCHSGARGQQACQRLQAEGFANIVNVDGGTKAWDQAGLPVVRGQKAMSLERQVRIAAGSLVLIGSLLGAFVHPYFLGLAAFVGAGLVFAGLTDTCGMGMLLARMPWNRVATAPPAASAGGAMTNNARGECCSNQSVQRVS